MKRAFTFVLGSIVVLVTAAVALPLMVQSNVEAQSGIPPLTEW